MLLCTNFRTLIAQFVRFYTHHLTTQSILAHAKIQIYRAKEICSLICLLRHRSVNYFHMYTETLLVKRIYQFAWIAL
jgi:hypothetical protein